MPISSSLFLQASRTSLTILTIRGILRRYYRSARRATFTATFLRGFQCLPALSNILASLIR
jgi:hypothetical protein